MKDKLIIATLIAVILGVGVFIAKEALWFDAYRSCLNITGDYGDFGKIHCFKEMNGVSK